MTDERLADVLWIATRLRREPFGTTQSWAMLHTTRQIAKAVRRETYPHVLNPCDESFKYGWAYARRAALIFETDPVLQRMATEASKAPIVWMPESRDLDMIGDWIEYAATAEPEVWDKIMRMDFAEIDRRQRTWHEAMERAEDPEVQAADLVHTYPDGWTWQHLRTKDQRIREGAAMQHCVGTVSFDGLLDTSAIFSLRDPAGKSIATVLMSGTWVQQAYGRRNSEPVPEAIRRIEDLRFHLGDNLDAGLVAWTEDGDWPKRSEPMPAQPSGISGDVHTSDLRV